MAKPNFWVIFYRRAKLFKGFTFYFVVVLVVVPVVILLLVRIDVSQIKAF
jgi:hypothetical protein